MRLTWFVTCILFAATRSLAAGGSDDTGVQFFESKIRPLLVENCYKCHATTAKKIKANLYLDSREGTLKGGDNGPAIVIGKPEQSKLIEAISWANPDLQMPPKQKLSEQQVADLNAWIKMGAPWPGGETPKPVAAVRVFDLQQRKSSFWCWKPIGKFLPPDVKDAAWAKSPIDHFILAKLEQKGIAHADRADRHVLIRRAYFDLIGLPPTPAEVEAFVNDPSPDAFEKVVDHLLASDHFGERWGRHWMDLVRFGETRGHEFDPVIPNAFQYRDYVIRAFNADVPYNRFVMEHLAGDLLAKPRLNPEKGFNESVLGTGFWFLGEEVHSPVDIRQDEADRLNNRVDTMTKAFLGLTVGCARCHDHKFDAISNKDFYALTGFTLSAGYRQVPFMSMQQNRHVAEQLEKLREESTPKLAAEAIAAERPGLAHLADELLAYRQIIREGGERSANIPDIAKQHALDPAMLRAWFKELTKAKNDRAHPLHDFAIAANDPSADLPAGFAGVRQQLVDGWNVYRKQTTDQAQVDQVIVDYDAINPGQWFEDGSAFGLRRIRAGEVLVGTAIDRPIVGIARRGMARRDPAFKDLRLAPGTEADYGGLGGWHRPGQTLRTPTVTLKTGHLWYLVRGAGHAYAAVDSHIMIGGPLHGALLHQWRAERPEGWTWVRHDLTAYAGQRCHIEFTPNGAGELEIAKVVESEQTPPIEEPNAVLLSALTDSSATSIETLAAGYQRAFLATAERLTLGNIAGSADSRDVAQLAHFLIQRSALFRDAGLQLDTNEAAGKFIAAQSALASQVVDQSATAPAMEEGNGVDENILVRGVAKNTGVLVPRRFLEAIDGSDQPAFRVAGSGRMELAEAVLDNNDPFVSRVMVNRVWQHLFGRGIVPTVDNFGVLGQLPTHPELLDYLADHFRTDQHWSVKTLIRSIVLSSTYQMSSKPAGDAEQADPENLTINHMPIRRLEAEPIRDALLAVSGRLDPTVGGPSIEVHLTEFMEGRGRPGSGPLDGAGRRSIYTRVRRNFLPPMMLAFDAPSPFACMGRRNVSNVPAQALILMNDPLVVQQAQLWAKRLLADASLKSPKDRIAAMYMTALSRAPKAKEVEDALAFIDSQAEAYGIPAEKRVADERPWGDLCHVMFNLKEFIFIE